VKTSTFTCILSLALLAVPFADAASHAKRATLTPFRERAARETLIKDRIVHKFGHAFADPIVNDPRLVLPQPAPSAAKPSHHANRHDYRYMFTADALATGRKFLEENKTLFAENEAAHGIPSPIINALLGIELGWGNVKPKRLVIVSLYSLAVNRPNYVSRGWPEEQLMAWLTICKNNGWDPFAMTGSWTGAFGLDQEEPTTYLQFAKNCVSEGNYSDPFSARDAVCRITNYLGNAGFGETRSSILKALWEYNHDPAYGRAIMEYASIVKPLP